MLCEAEASDLGKALEPPGLCHIVENEQVKAFHDGRVLRACAGFVTSRYQGQRDAVGICGRTRHSTVVSSW